jgi:hypothetical protein
VRIRGLTSFFSQRCRTAVLHWHSGLQVSSIREETIRLVLRVRSYSVVGSAVWFFEVPRMSKSICRLQELSSWTLSAAQLLDDCSSFCASLVKPILRPGSPPQFCFAALSSPKSQLTYQFAPRLAQEQSVDNAYIQGPSPLLFSQLDCHST